jgi:tetratricopeptide (TPR) repeat protein
LLVTALSSNRLALAHGDLDVRIGQVTAQLGTNPQNATLWLQRADLRREHGELDTALADANRAQQLRPDWAAPRLQAARIQFAQNLFSDAHASAEEALRLAACRT